MALPVEGWKMHCSQCPMVKGCHEVIVLCTHLAHGGIPFGYLIAALEPGQSADAEEFKLFKEIAEDLAYALNVLEMEKARQESERQRQLLEDQLFQAQKLEAVGRLAGGVAHDFNNMLGVILGHAELALMRTDPAHPLHTSLEEILKAAKRSAELTRQLLAFARRQTIAPKVLDLNATVEGMFAMLRRLIGEDINLTWAPKADVWSVKMDPAQIDQILANLCVNARDAISGVGKITIETANITFNQGNSR